MDLQTKTKTINLEDLQISILDVYNKVYGNIGVCSTAAGTATKEVTLGTIFSLVSGATVLVKFTYGITVANATLAITHTPLGGSSTTEAAKPIYYEGAALKAGMVKAGTTVPMRYDGTRFNIIGSLSSDVELYPVNIDSMTVSSTFRKNSIVALDGVVYRAKVDTSAFPFPLVVDGSNNFVVDSVNGKQALVTSSETLNSDWEVFLDCSNDYQRELDMADKARQGEGFGICETAGGTAAKTVYIQNFKLRKNAFVTILFRNGFTASSPTLNISGTGAKAMRLYGSALPMYKIRNNTQVTMCYDGTYFNVVAIESQAGAYQPDAVDLGLPSGLLWCEHNVGASKPEEAGLYFSWGNVVGHAEGAGYDFSDADYAETLGKALTGNIAVGETYDAARHNMGAPWRMPTTEDFQELNNNCTHEWVDEDGVNGMRFISKINGNSIFFPAAGWIIYNMNRKGLTGCYLSSTYNSATLSDGMGFESDQFYLPAGWFRNIGYSIRPVQ